MEKAKESFGSLLPESLRRQESHYSPVYEDDANSSEGDNGGERRTHPQRPERSRLLLIIKGFIIYLLGMASALVISHFNSPNSSDHYLGSYSPVQHLASYENRIAFPKDDYSSTGWNGPPTPATNESWFRIAERKLMVLPREDLERAGENLTHTAELKTGGFLATFAVFHDLHCLEKIRWYVYRSHFYPSMTPEQEEGMIEHIDHCIDTIRAATMCTGDLSTYTYELKPKPHGDGMRLESKTKAERRCIKLDPVMDWVHARQLPREMAVDVD